MSNNFFENERGAELDKELVDSLIEKSREENRLLRNDIGVSQNIILIAQKNRCIEELEKCSPGYFYEEQKTLLIEENIARERYNDPGVIIPKEITDRDNLIEALAINPTVNLTDLIPLAEKGQITPVEFMYIKTIHSQHEKDWKDTSFSSELSKNLENSINEWNNHFKNISGDFQSFYYDKIYSVEVETVKIDYNKKIIQQLDKLNKDLEVLQFVPGFIVDKFSDNPNLFIDEIREDALKDLCTGSLFPKDVARQKIVELANSGYLTKTDLTAILLFRLFERKEHENAQTLELPSNIDEIAREGYEKLKNSFPEEKASLLFNKISQHNS